MNHAAPSRNQDLSDTGEFARLVGQLTDELRNNPALGDDEILARYPEHANQLGALLPTLRSLVDLPGLRDSTNGRGGESSTLSTHGSEVLGDFRIVRELGRGGMGTVFEAEQLSMGRRVALKVLPFAALAHDNALKRFRNEVRAAAALDHPHIVPVYSVGEERGIHYYSMQLIRGQTLADLISQLRTAADRSPPADSRAAEAARTHSAAAQPPTTRRDEQARPISAVGSQHSAQRYRAVARLGIEAAGALQHAHDNGVLHRDIKPSNLMLDSDGKLYVTDFGLARLETDVGMTMTGDIVGTLRYMAPEQALATRVVVDDRADVYSLGATLYELLTLQPAFAEADPSKLLKQIASDEPRPLRKLDRRIPAELQTIVLTAMAKNASERYQTAHHLAEDLRAFLEDRPITAKPPTLLSRTAKWSRRHRSVVTATASVLVLALVGLSTANVLIARAYHKESEARQMAEQAFATAEAQRKRAEEQKIAADSSRFRMERSLQLAQAVRGSTLFELDRYKMLLGSDSPVNLQRSDAPILQWDASSQSGPQMGWMYVWSSSSRPEVIGSAFTYHDEQEHISRTQHELISIAMQPVTAEYNGRKVWAPTEPGIELRPVTKGPPPAETPAGRLAQIEALAEQFVVEAHDEGAKVPLTSKMLFRYPQSVLPLIDGAIVGFLDHGDPEAILLLEARSVNGSRRWEYGFVSAAGLRTVQANRLGHLVWRDAAIGGTDQYLQIILDRPDAQPSTARQSTSVSYPVFTIPDVPRKMWSAMWSQLHLIRDLIAEGKTSDAMQLLNQSEALVKQFASSMSDTRREQLGAHLDLLLAGLAGSSNTSQEYAHCVIALADIGLAIAPDDRWRFLNMRAWILATHHSEHVRDGRRAVQLATEACELTDFEDVRLLDTLAAAYAEAGDFESAVKWAEEVMRLAPGSVELARHLDRFRNRRPWRQ